MKKQLLKNHFAFIITVMMFLITTESANAQKKCNANHKCPPGYSCFNGQCVQGYFCQCGIRGYGCQTSACKAACSTVCGFALKVNNGDSTNNSSTTAFQFTTSLSSLSENPTLIFGKVESLTIQDSKAQQDIHQLAWKAINKNGNVVNPGVDF